MILHSVDLGKDKLLIPVERIGLSGSSFHVMITAGLEGDEYAGIQAAYILARECSQKKYPFEITIIPIVNLVGFLTHQSKNPLDGKFLKLIFPGKRNGSSSERLMFWLYNNFISSSQIWIDLHSGSLTEELTPFIYSSETDYEDVNQITKNVIRSSQNGTALFTKNKNSFIESVAKRGVAYIRLESGQRGELDKKWVLQHVKWVQHMLSNLVQSYQSDSHAAYSYPMKLYRKSIEYRMTRSGIWYPACKVGDEVVSNRVLGSVYTLDQKLLCTMEAKTNGVLLWQNTGMYIEKNESMLEIASDLQY